MEGGNWRDGVEHAVRMNVIQRVVDALRRHNNQAPDAELHKIASQFEQNTLMKADSYENYLNKIAAKLHSIDTKGQAPPQAGAMAAAMAMPATGMPAQGSWGHQPQMDQGNAVLAQQQQLRMQQRSGHLAQAAVMPTPGLGAMPNRPSTSLINSAPQATQHQPQQQYSSGSLGSGPGLGGRQGMVNNQQQLHQQAFDGQVYMGQNQLGQNQLGQGHTGQSQQQHMMHARQRELLIAQQKRAQEKLRADQAAQQRALKQQQLLQSQQQQLTAQQQLLQQALQQQQQEPAPVAPQQRQQWGQPPPQQQLQQLPSQSVNSTSAGSLAMDQNEAERSWARTQQMKAVYYEDLKSCHNYVTNRIRALESQGAELALQGPEHTEKLIKIKGMLERMIGVFHIPREGFEKRWQGGLSKLDVIEVNIKQILKQFARRGNTESEDTQQASATAAAAKQQALLKQQQQAQAAAQAQQQQQQQKAAAQARALEAQLKQQQEEAQRKQQLQQQILQQQQQAAEAQRKREEQQQQQQRLMQAQAAAKARQKQQQEAAAAARVKQQQEAAASRSQAALQHLQGLTPAQKAAFLKKQEAMLGAKIHASSMAAPSPPLAAKVATPPLANMAMTPPVFQTPSPNVASASTPPQDEYFETLKAPTPQQDFQAPTPPLQASQQFVPPPQKPLAAGASPQVMGGVKGPGVKQVIELEEDEEDEEEKPEEEEEGGGGAPLERLSRKAAELSASSQGLLQRAVEDLASVLRYAESAALGSSGGGANSRALVGEDLVAATRARVEGGGQKGGKRKAISVAVAVLAADGTSRGLSAEDPAKKRLRTSASWQSEVSSELRALNSSLIETSVEVDETATQNLKRKGQGGLVVLCTFSAAPALGVPPLKVLVPSRYPKVSVEVLPDPLESTLHLPLAEAARRAFTQSLQRLPAPLGLSAVARAWDESARSALAEAALAAGGGSFSTAIATWQSCAA